MYSSIVHALIFGNANLKIGAPGIRATAIDKIHFAMELTLIRPWLELEFVSLFSLHLGRAVLFTEGSSDLQ